MADSGAILKRLFQAAVDAAHPRTCFPDDLPDPPRGRTIVLGAGKASAAMASAFLARWTHGPVEGCVVTRYGHGEDVPGVNVIEAGHPAPDEAGLAASRKILDLARSAGTDDLVVALISGGGSALLTLPPPGVPLADQRALTRQLLSSGAPISDINVIRRSVSAIKGGRLAAACHPARLVTYVISDVPGDDPALVASGPTIASPRSGRDAAAIVRTFGLKVPASIAAHWARGGGLPDTEHSSYVETAPVHVIATAMTALEGARRAARAMGVGVTLGSDRVEGEAREVGRAMVREVMASTEASPHVWLSGGETTVTLGDGGGGRGGRNTELLLAMAAELNGAPGIHALAADTDGIDGTEDNAGALIGPETAERARGLGLDMRAHLARHDAYGFFEALGDLVMTGPTGTNVNDFRAVLRIRPSG